MASIQATGIGGAGLVVGTGVGPGVGTRTTGASASTGSRRCSTSTPAPPPRGTGSGPLKEGSSPSALSPSRRSAAGSTLSAPVVGVAESAKGGYWQASADGTVLPQGAGSSDRWPDSTSTHRSPESRPPERRRVLPRGGRRRGVRIWRCPLHGLYGGSEAQRTIVGIAATADDSGLLPRSPLTEASLLRRRFVPRVHGRQAARPTDRGPGRRRGHLRLLACRQRRWSVRLRIHIPGFQGRPVTRCAGGWHRLDGRSTSGIEWRCRRRRLDFGTAQFFGSMAGKPLNEPVVGIASVG